MDEIRRRGARAGLALNPGTSLAVAGELWTSLDLLLIMAVNPGFGGQAFIPASVEKVRRAVSLLESAGSPALIEVDGGVSPANAGSLAAAGCDILAAGSSLFSGGDVSGATAALRRAASGCVAPA